MNKWIILLKGLIVLVDFLAMHSSALYFAEESQVWMILSKNHSCGWLSTERDLWFRDLRIQLFTWATSFWDFFYPTMRKCVILNNSISKLNFKHGIFWPDLVPCFSSTFTYCESMEGLFAPSMETAPSEHAIARGLWDAIWWDTAAIVDHGRRNIEAAFLSPWKHIHLGNTFFHGRIDTTMWPFFPCDSCPAYWFESWQIAPSDPSSGF